jgi:hypothetical protein
VRCSYCGRVWRDGGDLSPCDWEGTWVVWWLCAAPQPSKNSLKSGSSHSTRCFESIQVAQSSSLGPGSLYVLQVEPSNWGPSNLPLN